MSSTDQKTEFGLKSGTSVLNQDYLGAFQLNTKLIKGNLFDYRGGNFGNEDTCGVCGTTDYAWLSCCSYDNLDEGIKNDYTPSLVDVFDCEHCKISK
jgi:hypothetical protein